MRPLRPFMNSKVAVVVVEVIVRWRTMTIRNLSNELDHMIVSDHMTMSNQMNDAFGSHYRLRLRLIVINTP